MLTFKTLQLENIRLYQGRVALYPSVTSVLGILADPVYITKWKRSVGEREAERIINTARARGKYIHAMAEHYFNGSIKRAPLTEKELMMIVTDKNITDKEISFYSGEAIIPDAIPVDEKIKKFAVAFNIFIATHGSNITETFACEQSLVSERFGIGGKPDWIGMADGLITLDDYKTSSTAQFDKETEQKYLMQTCAYAAMWNVTHPDRKIERIRIIPFTNARKNGLGETVIVSDREKMKYYFKQFMFEVLPIFNKLFTTHPAYAEYAFKLHSPVSAVPETRQPSDSSSIR